ncbi:hypothetical protein D9613_003544 [Agrocybe pediades]|uniref:BTB domain-containing protein n=1 Tax=Agrocybe pediades TaxID=84607 RepID=A0A8H4QR87_9AGAR|nr:hypothetical protein D9613_003544 [Agrocybe pediades]
MPTTQKEFVSITDLLAGIVRGYPASSIFREYIQNSDDARASIQIFILDERVFLTESLVDDCLKETQGPALICINDGIIHDADWKALQSIHASSKKEDTNRTGKNGLGFRASYHFTENPHILSGRKLLILDPHRRFEEHPGGAAIDIVNEGTQFPDQLSPFTSFVQDANASYSGTIFRLPLRTENQASITEIIKEKKATTSSEILGLFNSFCANELEKVILFLKSVQKIEFRHIKADGTETVIAMASIEAMDGRPQEGTLRRQVNLKSPGSDTTSREWCFHYFSPEQAQIIEYLSSRLGENVSSRLVGEKLAPAISLAYPIEGPAASGRLFTLLPLPIPSGLPVHLDALFAIEPHRQSLQNAVDVGTGNTRERFLVEWNKMLFEVVFPKAWAALIDDTAKFEEPISQFWSIWPPDLTGNNNQWANITTCTLLEIAKSGKSVFPLIANDPPLYASLQDTSLLLSNANPGVELGILASLSLSVTQPPPHIYEILHANQKLFKAGFVSPNEVYQRLLKIFPASTAPSYTPDVRRIMVDYLSSSQTPRPTATFIPGIAWFTLTNGSRVALGRSSRHYIMPASEVELSLFGDHCSLMLSWDGMSESFRRLAGVTANKDILNITSITSSHIVSILQTKLGPNAQSQGSSRQEEHAWLIDFWKWITAQEHLRQSFFLHNFRQQYSELPLLPRQDGTIAKFSEKAIVFDNVDASTIAAWAALGVSPLHHELLSASRQMKECVERPWSADFANTLIRTCDLTSQDSLSKSNCLAIQTSLANFLPSHTTQDIRDKLTTMRVFKTRTSNDLPWSFTALYGSHPPVFINVPDGFPLPIQSSSVNYVNMRDNQTVTVVKYALNNTPYIQDEKLLLRKGFENWNSQPDELKGLIVDWVFRYRSRLGSALLDQFNGLPYVRVNGVAHRVIPQNLIDPTSALRTIYAGEVGRFPVNDFANAYLPILREFGLVKFRFDETIVKERIEYFTATDSEHDAQIIGKVKHFIAFCNASWAASFHTIIVNARALNWLPLDDGTLCSPQGCRDSIHANREHENPAYYDLAMKVLPQDVHIVSPAFRTSLGWTDPVPGEILYRQFRLTLERRNAQERYERLASLIDYFGRLHGDNLIGQKELQNLKDLTSRIPWIPAASSSTGRLVRTEHATFVDDVELKPPFERVRPRYSSFLTAMGCLPRPAFSTLTHYLGQLDYRSPPNVKAGIAILEEIVTQHPDFDRSQVSVPVSDNRSLNINEVFFPDTRYTGIQGIPNNLVPAHSMISQSLAQKLGMQFLSSIVLNAGEDDDDDDDDYQMSEDLVGRIQDFLRGYDAEYAVNEFIANADDARAKSFALALNKMPETRRGDAFLSAGMQKLIGENPSLVFYNNALLSDADFRGIVNVGRGGKVDKSETHGRHGLGALSCYYFTDVTTVISGEWILFLDPAGSYLPPRRRNGRRTALRRKLADFMRQYPDQMASYGTTFGFSSTTNNYPGTLFILPLYSTINNQKCTPSVVNRMFESSYWQLAQNALFFTGLEAIWAEQRAADGVGPTRLWRISATRSAELPLGSDFRRFELTITREYQWTRPLSEQWLVATSENALIPMEHEETATSLKLNTNVPILVQLAVRLDPLKLAAESQAHHLFSTVRLPHSTSLPFHINARFAISSNRKSVVLSTADATQRLDKQTAYNRWIIDQVVPALYLSSFEHLLHTYSPNVQSGSKEFYTEEFWLLNVSDDLAKMVRDGVFSMLPDCEHKLVKPSSGGYVFLCFNESTFSDNEPHSVRRILRSIKHPTFVYSPRLPHLATIPGAQTVNPEFVRDALMKTAVEDIERLLADGKIEVKAISEALEYVSKLPLAGLPLIFTSIGKLHSVPGPDDEPIYYSHNSKHVQLFPSVPFIKPGLYSSEVINALLLAQTNVVELEQANILSVVERTLSTLADEGVRADWTKSFWVAYKDLPGPPTLDELERAGFAVVPSSSGFRSLKDCIPTKMVFLGNEPRSSLWPMICRIMSELDIEVLYPVQTEDVNRHFSQSFGDIVSNFIRCLRNPNDIKVKLGHEDQKELSSWLLTSLSASNTLNSISKAGVAFTTLLSVPLWWGQSSAGKVLCSAADLESYVVRNAFDIKLLLPFQRQGTVVIHAKASLSVILKHCKRHNGNMTASQMLEVLELPTTLSPTEARGYAHIYSALLQSCPPSELRYIGIRVPDRDGALRLIREFYDDTVTFFVRTLSFTNTSSFVHPAFTGLQPVLAQYGLNTEVTFDTFLHCATAIDTGLQAYETSMNDSSATQGTAPGREDLHRMSQAAFEVFCNDLPSKLMLNSWHAFNDIRFIRPHTSRRQGAPFDTDRYCKHISSVLCSPNLLVAQEYEPIAWTQRLLFLTQPSEQLRVLNRELGVPKASEVVEHLKVLATQVARDHPGNSVVLSDLKATYKWLNENANNARPYLLQISAEKMFLNVDDPTTSHWTGKWVAANEMLLNLHYDMGQVRQVRTFLQDYGDLLSAAGTGKLEGFSRSNQSHRLSSLNSVSLRDIFNNMRTSGELLDVELVPEMSTGDRPVATDGLRAHRAFLAACIPHVRAASTGGWQEHLHIEFPGTYTGAKALIDYFYIGKCDLSTPKPGLSRTETEVLLRDVLDLLKAADQWDIPELKSEMENAIIHTHDLIQRMPHYFDTLMEAATESEASALVEALNEFRSTNSSIWQQLMAESDEEAN